MFNDFVFPNKDPTERKENVHENMRHNARLEKMSEIIQHKMSLNNSDINDPNYHQDLKSFSGATLSGNKEALLDSYMTG